MGQSCGRLTVVVVVVVIAAAIAMGWRNKEEKSSEIASSIEQINFCWRQEILKWKLQSFYVGSVMLAPSSFSFGVWLTIYPSPWVCRIETFRQCKKRIQLQ